MDGVSWRVLAEDLETALRQAAAGDDPALPPRTTSFRTWAEALERHARSERTRSQLPFWLGRRAPSGAGRLPRDRDGGPGRQGSARRVTRTLDREATARLLREVASGHGVRADELVLAGLASTLAAWSGRRSLLVDLEGHGREEGVADVDLSRTVGWFTTVYPVLLELPAAGGPREELRAVAGALRAVPERGLGYGLLRYLGTDDERAALAASPGAEVSFNYLGQFDGGAGDDLLAVTGGETGPDVSPLAERTYLLEVDGSVLDGRLSVYWTFGPESLDQATVERLASEHVAALRRFEDAPAAEADAGAEEVWELSPLQRSMLDEHLLAPRYGQSLYQWVLDLDGDLDPAAWTEAWRAAIGRHGALRAAFDWAAGREPAQVVRRPVPFEVRRLDWSRLDEREVESRTEAALREVQGRGLDLRRAPLLDAALARLPTGAQRAMVTWSLLALDVPSFVMVLDEVLARCAPGRTAVATAPAPAHSYREYVEWARGRDLAGAEAYWRRALAGVELPAPALFEPPDPMAPRAYEEPSVWLSREQTDGLLAFARHHRVTPNAVLQGVWGLCLAERSGRRDLVFGTIVDSRPAELPDADLRIGRFVNFVPVRARVPAEGSFAAWSRELQGGLFEMLPHAHVPDGQIARWCGREPGQDLYQTLVAWERGPLRGVDGAPHWRIVRDASRLVQEPRVAVKLTGTLHDRLWVTLAYLPDQVRPDLAGGLLERVVELLGIVAGSEDELRIERLRRLSMGG